MDSKEIRELIELISRSNFKSFELEHEGFRLKLVKGVPAPVAGPPVPASAPASPRLTEAQAAAPTAPAEAAPDSVPAASMYELRAPIVGTFYRSPGPDAASFAEVGDRVKKGQTICIVEAMKVMNEIESEIDGEIVEVAVANGQPVEYGEVLFRMRPSA